MGCLLDDACGGEFLGFAKVKGCKVAIKDFDPVADQNSNVRVGFQIGCAGGLEGKGLLVFYEGGKVPIVAGFFFAAVTYGLECFGHAQWIRSDLKPCKH